MRGERQSIQSSPEDDNAPSMLRLETLPSELVLKALSFVAWKDLFLARPVSKWMRGTVDEALSVIPAEVDLTRPSLRSVLDDAILTQLFEKLPCMVSLDISGCRGITHEGIIAVIRRCERISKLAISCVDSASDETLEVISICGAHKLCSLDISGGHGVNEFPSSFTTRGIDAIASFCCNLTEINISFCRSIDDGGLVRLVSTLSKLQKIAIAECIQFSESAIAEAFRVLPESMLHLDARATNVADDAMDALASRCSNLESLNISHCESISERSARCSFPSLLRLEMKGLALRDAGVVSLVSSSSAGLRELNVSNVAITDDCLLRIASTSALSNLRSLILMGCTNITDVGVISIANAAPLLIELNLQACFEVTGESVCIVAARCPKLTHVTLAGCNLINDLALYDIVLKCRNLLYLDINMCFGISEKGRGVVERAAPSIQIMM